MSLLGSISHGIETAAGTFTHSFEAAAGIMDLRHKEIGASLLTIEQIPVIETQTTPVKPRLPEQAPTFPLNTVDFVPALATPETPETLAPVAFTDETFTSAIPTAPQPNSDLDADEIRAKLDTIRYAQMDTQALADMANRSRN